LQSANGSFVWGDVIAKLFNKSKKKLLATNPGTAEILWITALAVRALEEMATQKNLWDLVPTLYHFSPLVIDEPTKKEAFKFLPSPNI